MSYLGQDIGLEDLILGPLWNRPLGPPRGDPRGLPSGGGGRGPLVGGGNGGRIFQGGPGGRLGRGIGGRGRKCTGLPHRDSGGGTGRLWWCGGWPRNGNGRLGLGRGLWSVVLVYRPGSEHAKDSSEL